MVEVRFATIGEAPRRSGQVQFMLWLDRFQIRLLYGREEDFQQSVMGRLYKALQAHLRKKCRKLIKLLPSSLSLREQVAGTFMTLLVKRRSLQIPWLPLPMPLPLPLGAT